MAKPAGTHQPLGYRARVRLNAAVKHLKSPFHAVRVAAHKEIQAILNRKRGVRRLRAWLASKAQAGVRKVTPSQLHKPLGLQPRTPKAPKRGQATPIRAHMPKNGFTPLTDHTLTRAELRQRAKADRQAGRGSQLPQQPARPQPVRKPDAMKQAQDAMRQAHARPAPQPARASTPAPVPGWIRDSRTGEPFRAPEPPGHPESIRKAAQDHEKGRWAGLRGRLATERTTRSRTRSA